MINDIQLSEHFTLGEFISSSTAAARNINNIPSLDDVDRLQQLCRNVLEPLRNAMGKPIIISSGFRCPALNRAVGGSTTSQHMKGEAADIRVPNSEEGNKMFSWIKKNCKFDQLIRERATASSTSWWIHVSWSRKSCRMQVITNLIKNK